MMLFSNFVLSKLTSRLRPWLLEDPESELRLGFLASQGYARSLSFNPSVLNPLIGDCTRLEFKLVEIGELRVCFRPWSSPSIVVEVQGLHNGASLHDAIVRLLHLDDPGNRFMTSWVDVISSCSEIKFHDTLLELQLIEESHVCLLEMDKCYFEPQFLRRTSFFRKFLGSFLMTGKGSELSISFHMLKFGMKKNDHVSCIISSSVFFAYIKLIGVNVWSNSICVPSMDIKLSPEVTKVLSLMLDVLSSNEHSAVRTGKELWRRAAERKHLLTGNPKSSFQNVVEMVVLWLRYVRIYNSLLKQVLTLEATYLKENLGKVPIRKRLTVHSKNQFGLIFELEQKLPAQAVAQARRIARKDPLFSSTDLIPSIGQVNSVLRKIFEPFWLLWKLICFVLLSISNSVSIFLKVLGLHYGSHWSRSLKHVNSSCFSFTEVLITFSFSTPRHSPITEEAKKEAEVNPPTFCLVVRQACIVCKTRDTKVSVFAALGEIKLCLCSLHVQLHRDFTGKRNKPLSLLRSGSHDQSKDIIWSSPALLCRPQEVTDDNSLKNFSIILDNHVRNLWLKWKKISETLELNILQEDKAFLLCEFKSYLTKPNVENTVHGLWKCSLNVGKLSIDLDYKSMFSAGFLLREMKPNNRWATRVGRKQATSFSSSNLGDNCEITVENKIEIYVNKFLAAISHKIPHKNIHAGVLISGLDIHISLEEKSSEVITPATAQGNSYHWFEVHIGIMELVIWPATKAVLAAITGEAHIGEATSQYIWLKEPRLLDTSLKHNEYVTFNSHVRHTLNASLRFTALSASSGFKFSTYTQILEPVSLEIMASICRYKAPAYNSPLFNAFV
ncbi:hypothetical protein AXF42_Ash019949 [Apostasia shenzhenica]|uniref:Uncharacterized protein n=1 Tax=Apostasia shenzhenica TaxID=1088818 RepID=A0A2I0AZH9_9ASPA|nr:hypothetical protein AXF42_Ash019949 [Apostasia shenzhenica]